MPIVGLVLFLGAWVGHTALLCFSLNWWYGVPLPRRLHTALRLLHGLLVLAFPVGLGLTYGFDLPEGLTATWSEPLRTASTAYLVLCWAVGFGVLPLITLVRLLRRPPAALVAEHARTVDVAAELGYKPLGH